MQRVDVNGGWKWMIHRQAWIYLWLPIIVISILHYTTGATHHWMHDIFRRLYYIPIVLGAFAFGLKGALAASLLASLVYAPHAFTHLFEHDPARGVEKILEIMLYNVVAVITGALANAQYKASKRLEKALEEKEEMERQLIRSGRLQALGELTAGLAHEIKNPLASLKGSADIIADEIALDSPRRRMVDILIKELDRLDSLLERFLKFARPGASTPKPLALCRLVDKTVALSDAQARKTGVAIDWRGQRTDWRITGDEEQIMQVILNLLLNAVQASSENSLVEITCEIKLRGSHRFVVISVKDQGPGVAEAIREDIFNPFFTTKESGTGLGLSIASRIMDEHNGFIEVSKREGGGSVFQVYFPISDNSS